MFSGIQRSSLRTFGQVVSAALVAALFTVSPIAPQAPAEAAGDLGWNSEIDYHHSNSGTSFWTSSEQVIPSDGTFTVEGWAFSENLNVNNILISQGDVSETFYIKLVSGALVYHVDGLEKTCAPEGSISTDEWFHFAVTANSTTHACYLNGQLAASNTGTVDSFLVSGTHGFHVGALSRAQTEHTIGGVDQVKIWDSALTEAQVQTSMHSLGSGGISNPSLLHHYDFNEGSGSVAYDRVGSADLTANGSPGFTDVKVQSMVGDDVIITLPRTYLPGLGGWTVPANLVTASALVVGGGGAGGSSYDSIGAGGGGAGGFVQATLDLEAGSTVSVVIGQGGFKQTIPVSGYLQATGRSGQNSIFDSEVAIGGGGGSGRSGQGLAGGSGGGTGGRSSFAGGATLDSSQGFSGGGSSNNSTTPTGGGGGGGASSAGGSVSTGQANGGAGGSGSTSSLVAGTFSVGGDGGSVQANTPGSDAAPYTGNGGQGASAVATNPINGVEGQSGGSGGSGVVVIRYTPQNTLTFESFGSAVGSITATTASVIAQPAIPTTSSEAVFLGWTTTQGDATTIVSWPHTLSESDTFYGLWRSSPGLKSEVDYAMSLTGTQYVGTTSANPFPSSRTSPFTVEAWINETQGTSATGDVVSIGTPSSVATSFNLRIETSGGARKLSILRNNNNSYTDFATVSKAVIPQGRWVHIALTYDGSGTFQVFQDGNLVDTITNFGFTADLAGNFSIGQNYYHSIDKFRGQIDQVKIWHKVLTASEVIASMHNLGSGGITNLAHHWDFNDDTASFVADREGTIDLLKSGSPSFVDVKSVVTSGSATILTFPRTYLPGVGGWTVPNSVSSLDALVVGGGGGGAGSYPGAEAVAGGSGGGGGVYSAAGLSVTGTVSIAVGQGGVPGQGRVDTNRFLRSGQPGQNSQFGLLVAGGGGGGGCESGTDTRPTCSHATISGRDGTAAGSGGSPSNYLDAYSAGAAGQATGVVFGGKSLPAVSGFPGGVYVAGASTPGSAGSAGGAGGAGTTNSPGIGRLSTISGEAKFYGTGGASWNSAAFSAAYPTPNSGIGGSGAYSTSSTAPGMGGASGVVILSYETAFVSVSSPVNTEGLSTKTASFTVSTAGSTGTLTYQWQLDSGSGFSNITGATSATYTTDALTMADNGNQYRVVVSSNVNGTTDTETSPSATLTVKNIVTERLILDYQASDINSFDPTEYPNSVSDLAGNFDGVLSGTSQVSLSDQSFSFDGGGGFIDVADIPSSLTFSDGITVDFIADFGSADNWERIFDFGNGPNSGNIFVTREFRTNNLAFQIDARSGGPAPIAFSNAILPGLNRYTLIADGSNVYLYTNGVFTSSVPKPSLPAAESRPNSFIGESNWSADDAFEGKIQHLRVFNAAFTGSMISEIEVGYRNVSFDSNGGTSYSPVSTSGALRLPSPAKVNSNFLGWFTSSNFSTPALGATYSPLASGSLYAQWIIPDFILTLDNEGATSSQTVALGSAPTDPSLTRAGYTLVGWSDGDDSTAEYLPDLSNYTMGNSNDTIYAVWVADSVLVTSGACSVTVSNSVGAVLTETDSGGCLLEFTSTGSNIFMVPDLVTNVQALVIGAGGGGGAARTGNMGGAGGGGGGGAHQVISITTTASQQIALTVGAGGAGGVNGDGQTGGSSLLSYGNSIYSMSHTLSGGAGGKRPNSWPGGGGQGGTGASGSVQQSSGASGGAGATDPGDRSYYQPRFGNSGRGKTFGEDFYCIGAGGGGGNREVAGDPYFHWEPRSGYCFGTEIAVGGSGGYHNGTAVVPASSGAANSGSGGGGGSYNRETNTSRAGAAGADGFVAFYFTPATGEISLSSVAAMSYSATTKTINLTKENPTTDVAWTTSDTAVCTVTGTSTTGTVSVLNAGLCEVSVVLAAQSPYGRGVANTSFQIDKIVRPNAPAWSNTSINVLFGGTYDLWPNITSNSGNSYRVSTSGTVGSCSVTGYTLNVGNVGDTCYLDLFQLGDTQYLEMKAATSLSVTVTPISQSPLVITSGNQMTVGGNLTVSAAGGSGPGAISYHVASDGGTGCQIDPSSGAITGTTAAGDCTVYAKRATSTNFDEVTSSNQVITVSKVNQVLQWVSQPQPQQLAGSSYALEATASSQLAVSYQIASGLCTLASTTVTFTGSGDCVIEAYQAGSPAVNAAVTISQTVSVGKINQTMTFSAIADKSWGSIAFSLSATVSSGLTIAYSENAQTTNDACDVTANGVVTIKNVGTCAITATQAGDSANTSVAKTQVFEVTANQAGAPFIGSVSFGDKSLTAAFFTPSYLGGGTVSAYQLTAHNTDGTVAATNSGCVAVAGANQTCTVIGLENGSTYYLRVAAITQAGLGELSASSSQLVPASNPEAVGNLTAVEGNGTLSLNWTEPTSFGGGNFFQYKIFWKAPGQAYQPLSDAGTAQGTRTALIGYQASTSYVITGLTNGVSYDVKIITATVTNNAELQSNTAEVNQTPYSVPDAPASVVALDNGSTVVIAWQPPTFDGGNPIDQYVVKKGSVTVCTITSVSTTSCEVAKPEPGTSNIEVRAGNDAGLSLPAQTTFVVQSVTGNNQVVAGSGGISIPGVTPIQTRPIVTAVSGSSRVSQNDLIRFVGTNMRLVDEVLVGGVAASFFVNSDTLITVRIPSLASAGIVVVTLNGSYGSVYFSDLVEVLTSQQQVDEKVTVGTFLGYAAVYTKNHAGKRLSMKIGNKWRVIESLGANYTYNLTKVGAGKTVTVMVYLDRQLVQIKQIKVQ